jgi:TRAP-type C4-dicarboxylate transport system substrate-binding protein
VLSITEHEANNALLFVSDKLWQSLSADQKQWVKTAARRSQRQGAGEGLRTRKGRGLPG